MRTRQWISFVALLSMLLHAGFLVRHNNSIVAAALHGIFAYDLTALCGVGPTDQNPDLPDLPTPVNSKCPICMGAAPAVALLAADIIISDKPVLSAPKLDVIADLILPRLEAVRPPSRAPPFLA